MTNLRTGRRVAVALAVSMAVAGCGAANEEEQVARQACELYADLLDADIDGDFDPDLAERFEDLSQRAQEADLDPIEFEEAIEAECPDTVAELEASFSEEP